MTKEEIEARYPFAVAQARELKVLFGDGVRIHRASQDGQDELVSAAANLDPVPAEPPMPTDRRLRNDS